MLANKSAPGTVQGKACGCRQAVPGLQQHRALSVRVAAQNKIWEPMHHEATAFAPATVANLGPGFDWMGCAVQVGAVMA